MTGALPADPARPALGPGPVLIVADNDAIARLAVRWQDFFSAAGRSYRVRLLSAGSPAELAAVAAEARSLAAGSILAAGSSLLVGRAARAATAAGLPLVVWDDPAAG